MDGAVQRLVGEAHWKLRTLEKSATYHCDAELVTLYKSKLLSYLEYHTPAIYHATDSVLEPLNKVQDRLLKVVGCSDEGPVSADGWEGR